LFRDLSEPRQRGCGLLLEVGTKFPSFLFPSRLFSLCFTKANSLSPSPLSAGRGSSHASRAGYFFLPRVPLPKEQEEALPSLATWKRSFRAATKCVSPLSPPTRLQTRRPPATLASPGQGRSATLQAGLSPSSHLSPLRSVPRSFL